jgi:ParB/RepB/Spo0J family partition protein
MLQPILVREVDGGRAYEVVSGHRRLAAAKELEWEEVPCLVHELDEVQALEVNLSEQINRRDLTPLEEGEACRSLIELSGYDKKQVAAKLGQSESWVSRRLQLCKLAPEAKKALAAKKIPYGAAVELALLPTHKLQSEVLAEALKYNDSVSVDQLLRQVERSFRPLKTAPWKLTDAELVPAAGACGTCPKNSACGPKGLFDSFDPKQAMCTDVKCFEEKLAADWEAKTEKAREAGAEIVEDPHVFNPGGDLTYTSEHAGIVKAKQLAEGDRKKRTWAQLVEELPEKHRPRLKVAKSREGAAIEIYDGNALRKALVKHLDMNWAKPKPKYDAHSGLTPAQQEKRKKEKALGKLRDAVVDEVLEHVTAAIAKNGLTVAELRRVTGHAFDASYELGDGPRRALGLFEKSAEDIEKWIAKAEEKQLQALLFACIATDSSVTTTYAGFSTELLALAKGYRMEPEKMLKARSTESKS